MTTESLRLIICNIILMWDQIILEMKKAWELVSINPGVTAHVYVTDEGTIRSSFAPDGFENERIQDGHRFYVASFHATNSFDTMSYQEKLFNLCLFADEDEINALNTAKTEAVKSGKYFDYVEWFLEEDWYGAAKVLNALVRNQEAEKYHATLVNMLENSLDEASREYKHKIMP